MHVSTIIGRVQGVESRLVGAEGSLRGFDVEGEGDGAVVRVHAQIVTFLRLTGQPCAGKVEEATFPLDAGKIGFEAVNDDEVWHDTSCYCPHQSAVGLLGCCKVYGEWMYVRMSLRRR